MHTNVTETKIKVSDIVESCICPFVHSLNRKSSAPMSGKGISVPCALREYAFEDMEGDHMVPWSKGGHTTDDNLQMLCKKCNSAKSDM